MGSATERRAILFWNRHGAWADADTRTLAAATETFVSDHRAAAAAGKAARDYAVAHFGMDRFQAEWDVVIAELTN